MHAAPGDSPQAATAPSPGRSTKRSWRSASELAVDLGTANTLIFVKGEGVVLNEPSVAALGPSGEVLGVGLEAKRMLGRTPAGIRAVRPMKDGVIADFHVAEQLLRRFIQLTLDRYLFRVKPTVIVCVPSGITEVERRAVRDAARSAGVKRLFMVSEPIAAAIGAGLPVDQPVGNMIVDVGGGTTDVAVIALSGVVCDASIRTAGDELDQSIVQYMRKNYSLLIGEPTAETVKMRIGSAMPFEREVELQVKGRDLVSGLPRTVTVESAGIRDAIGESIHRIVNAVRRALELTPPELARDILENGIMLTGGGALIRGLDSLLTFETGLPVRIDIDPLTSVVRGTGLILDDMPRWRPVLIG
ncbi:MAG: rod shape-determining protein [Gemmatimonadales bacterium]